MATPLFGFVKTKTGNVLNSIVATGGTITSATGRKFHTFTSAGTFTMTSNPYSQPIEVFAVGGGGGGGNGPNYGSGGGGGGAILAGYLPTTIPTCAIWLDSADTTSFTFSSASNITQWRDKSGLGNHFSVLSGTPTLTLDSPYSVVNIPSGCIMTSALTVTLTSNSAFFIVSKLTVSSGYAYLISFTSTLGSSNLDYSIRLSNGALVGTPAAGVGPGNASDIANSNYYVNGSFNPSYTSNTYYNTYSLIDTGTLNLTGPYYLTLSSSFSGRAYAGNISELLYYPYGVTSNQRQTIEGYLAQKWGLASSLPSSHLGRIKQIYGTSPVGALSSFSITIGNGGSAGTSSVPGQAGGSTTFGGTYTAYGGGQGCGFGQSVGGNGGSGGGGQGTSSNNAGTGGQGSNIGFAGGAGNTVPGGGGGLGNAGGVGIASTRAGDGGYPLFYNGSYYGGGGGGGSYSTGGITGGAAGTITLNIFTANTSYTVGSNITSLYVYLWGAGGGGGDMGGPGACVQGVLTVTPGETLGIVVGAGGGINYNSTYASNCGGGGGKSSIQRSGTDVVVAGGGGGGGYGVGGAYGGRATYTTQSYSGGSSYSTQVLGRLRTDITSLGGDSHNGGGANTTNGNGEGGVDYGLAGGGGGGYTTGGNGGLNNGGYAGGAGSSYTANLSLIYGQSTLGFTSSDNTAPGGTIFGYQTGAGNGSVGIGSGSNGLVIISLNALPYGVTYPAAGGGGGSGITGTSGSANTGGGGSGFRENTSAGSGGTGICIVSYDLPVSYSGVQAIISGIGWVGYVFTSVNQGRLTLSKSWTVDYLLVGGGGGGGGAYAGGGGGGGGLIYAANQVLTSGTYTISVGSGGAGGSAYARNGSNGGNTTFNGLSAVGGGGGAATTGYGQTGGSGGGGTYTTLTAGSGTSGQGNAGGAGFGTTSTTYSAGGGGGANASGSAGTSGAGGGGGTGTSISITGTATIYAEGGGGGGYLLGGPTPTGFGGVGGFGSSNGSNAIGYGCGGGGAGTTSATARGGSGSGGICIVRFWTWSAPGLSFNPSMLSSNVYWFDAADTSTITTSDSNLSSWANKGTGTMTLNSRTGTITSGTSSQNGRNVISFAASSTLTSATTTIAYNGRATYFIVYQKRGNITGDFTNSIYLLQANGVGNGYLNNRLTYGKDHLTSTTYFEQWEITSSGYNYSAVGNIPSYSSNTYQMLSIDAGASPGFWTFGGSTTGTGANAGDFWNGSTDPISVGYNAGTSDTYTMGGSGVAWDIAEYIVYSRELSSTERKQVEGYLAWKWGIQSSVVLGHPYANYLSPAGSTTRIV